MTKEELEEIEKAGKVWAYLSHPEISAECLRIISKRISQYMEMQVWDEESIEAQKRNVHWLISAEILLKEGREGKMPSLSELLEFLKTKAFCELWETFKRVTANAVFPDLSSKSQY